MCVRVYVCVSQHVCMCVCVASCIVTSIEDQNKLIDLFMNDSFTKWLLLIRNIPSGQPTPTTGSTQKYARDEDFNLILIIFMRAVPRKHFLSTEAEASVHNFEYMSPRYNDDF